MFGDEALTEKFLDEFLKRSRKMKRLFVCLSVLVVLLLIIGGAISCEEEEVKPVTLRFAMSLPPDIPQVQLVQEMVNRFNERTNGEYLIEIYAGESLIPFMEMFDATRTGAVEIGDIPIEYAAAQDPVFAAIGLPFLLDDTEAATKFLNLAGEEIFDKKLEQDFNLKPICTFSMGMHTWCGTKPIHTMEDWEGLLVWVANPVQAATVGEMGASAVSLPFFEGYPGIQKGVVDGGVALLPHAPWEFHWYDAIRHITIARMFGTAAYYMINYDVFKELPKDVQEILLEEGKRLSDESFELNLQLTTDYLANLEEVGVEVYYLPEAERERWKAASSSVIDDFFAQIGEADTQKIRDAAEAANQ